MERRETLITRDRAIVGSAFLLVLFLWCLVGFLPLISLNFDLFKLKTEKDVERVKSVLQQFGTYGDLFGVLNCLFSGLAFGGVVYAIILQSRELQNQELEMKRNVRTSDLQNRLTAYQSLAEHHRFQRDNAGNDKLLKARSNGRERAYAELMMNALADIEMLDLSDISFPGSKAKYYDHPARIRHLYYSFQNEIDSMGAPETHFGPMKDLLLSLVEEISALTVLTRPEDELSNALLQAGHCVNAAVEPEMHLESDVDDVAVRNFQIETAKLAFGHSVHAIKALGYVIQQHQ